MRVFGADNLLPLCYQRAPIALAIETQEAALAARIEVAAHNVADLDHRLNQVDTAIEEAAKRGKALAVRLSVAARSFKYRRRHRTLSARCVEHC